MRTIATMLTALLLLFCWACGSTDKYRTPMMKCLRRVENHTRAEHRIEVAKRECGWSPRPKKWASIGERFDG